MGGKVPTEGMVGGGFWKKIDGYFGRDITAMSDKMKRQVVHDE